MHLFSTGNDVFLHYSILVISMLGFVDIVVDMLESLFQLFFLQHFTLNDYVPEPKDAMKHWTDDEIARKKKG